MIMNLTFAFLKKKEQISLPPTRHLFPAPDFAVEILSDSTEKIDRGIKFIDYAAHGVPEYWIIDPEKKSVEKYLLQQGEYYLEVKLTTEGRLLSTVVEGFALELHELFT
jgi:Uma2 family endonuclease